MSRVDKIKLRRFRKEAYAEQKEQQAAAALKTLAANYPNTVEPLLKDNSGDSVSLLKMVETEIHEKLRQPAKKKLSQYAIAPDPTAVKTKMKMIDQGVGGR